MPKSIRTSLLLLLVVPVLWTQPAPATKLSAAQRRTVVESLSEALLARYVFPAVAAAIGPALRTRLEAGAYDALDQPSAFAETLTQDLRTFGKDGHFRVRHDPDFKSQPDDDRPPSPEEVSQIRTQVARRAFGIARVEQLPGNIGYLDLRGFGPTEFVGTAFSAALALLSGTEALVVDLRQNGGGDPESVAYFVSHFFAEGDTRLLNSIYSRTRDNTHQYWTSPTVNPRYLRPLYVLTSARTFSGGEECAYDFQTQKRAILVGETTGGGANPGGPAALAQGFVAFIPTGRAINPVTKGNWEGVGVKPDLAVPAAAALRTAHLAALDAILAKEKDADYRQRLEAIRSRVEKGETEPPVYVRR